MSRLPSDYSLLANFGELRDDIAYVRALRRLRVILPSGEVTPAFAPGAGNVALDLRGLSATGVPPPDTIPSQTGHAGAVLLTDGSSSYWSHPATGQWLSRVLAAGGTLATSSISIADSLARALAARSYSAKIVYLLPLLGGNLAAARIPLCDVLNVGPSANLNFVDADFSQATGLHGGSGKALDLLILPSSLGVAANGGLGFWARTIGAASNAAMGIYSTAGGGRVYSIELPTTQQQFWWGDGSSPAILASAPVAGHYYGQRSSATDRRLYRDGTQVAANTSSVSVAGIGDQTIQLMNRKGDTYYSDDTCSAAYLTDGTLTAGEITDFHTLLQTYLITPTGR